MIANYHTHTYRCNHARGNEEEYVLCALERGLDTLGFSDHTPYLFPGDYYSRFRMRPEELEDYCETVLELRRKYAGQIHIPLGLELEYYPAFLPRLMEVLRDSPVEYLLLGQHFVGNEIGEHYSGTPFADESILKTYCHQTAEAMNTGLFTYFAHPDLIHYLGDPKIYAHHMRLICREAKSCGIPLEVNLLGILEGRHYPQRLFWELAAEEGCQVILGVDAHDSRQLLSTASEEEALELIRFYGLTLLDRVSLRPI